MHEFWWAQKQHPASLVRNMSIFGCLCREFVPNTMVKPVTKTPRDREQRHLNGYTLGKQNGQQVRQYGCHSNSVFTNSGITVLFTPYISGLRVDYHPEYKCQPRDRGSLAVVDVAHPWLAYKGQCETKERDRFCSSRGWNSMLEFRSRVRGSVVGPFFCVAFLLSCIVSSEFKHYVYLFLDTRERGCSIQAFPTNG